MLIYKDFKLPSGLCVLCKDVPHLNVHLNQEIRFCYYFNIRPNDNCLWLYAHKLQAYASIIILIKSVFYSVLFHFVHICRWDQ